jgi:hypothetical protein
MLPEATVKGFRKCCISSAVDGDIRNECEKDAGTEFEDGDSDADW